MYRPARQVPSTPSTPILGAGRAARGCIVPQAVRSRNEIGWEGAMLDVLFVVIVLAALWLADPKAGRQ